MIYITLYFLTLLGKSNLDDYDTFILPQLPEDTPRPCSICLINRGWNTISNCINLPEQKSKPTKSIAVKPDSNRFSLTKKQKSSNNHQSNEPKVIKDKIINQTSRQGVSKLNSIQSNYSDIDIKTTPWFNGQQLGVVKARKGMPSWVGKKVGPYLIKISKNKISS